MTVTTFMPLGEPISARPDVGAWAEATWMAAMRRGDFEAAHRVSDRVLQEPAPDPRTTPRHLQRVWDGSPVDGRVVLVRCHHGLGDTIQFARLLPRLAQRARAVIVCAQAALLPLLRPLGTRFAWYPMTDDEPDVPRDMDVEIMELLHLLRVVPATIPRQVPYLWRPPIPADAKVRTATRPRVGVVWSAGDWAPQRSIPVAQLAPLLAMDTVEWCSLQHGTHVRAEHPALPVHPPRPVEQTAREMLTMDLVVSVDSMPAHLAGALGVPVWTLLANQADWRWMSGRVDTPWYPTMRLFRQPTAGDWSSVMVALQQALEVWRGGRAQ